MSSRVWGPTVTSLIRDGTLSSQDCTYFDAFTNSGGVYFDILCEHGLKIDKTQFYDEVAAELWNRLKVQKRRAFVAWHKARRRDNIDEEMEFSRTVPHPTALGKKFNKLSTSITDTELRDLEKYTDRPTPINHLGDGNHNGKTFKFRVRVHLKELERTFPSQSERDNGINAETSGFNDTRIAMTLLKSFYNDNESERLRALSKPAVVKESYRLESVPEEHELGHQASRQSSGAYESDASTRTKKSVSNKSSSNSGQSSGGSSRSFSGGSVSTNPTTFSEASDDIPEDFANRKDNLSMFCPIGPVDFARVEEGKDEIWRNTPWNLVMNIQDKEPWLVLNVFQRDDSGAGQHEYLLPGHRFETFVLHDGNMSAARLSFQSPISSSHTTPFSWEELFREGGTFNSHITLAHVKYCPSFVVGNVVWDEKAKQCIRAGDKFVEKFPERERYSPNWGLPDEV